MLKKLADWAELSRYPDIDTPLGDPKTGEQKLVF
jgi:hypothetical protein